MRTSILLAIIAISVNAAHGQTTGKAIPGVNVPGSVVFSPRPVFPMFRPVTIINNGNTTNGSTSSYGTTPASPHLLPTPTEPLNPFANGTLPLITNGIPGITAPFTNGVNAPAPNTPTVFPGSQAPVVGVSSPPGGSDFGIQRPAPPR
jgi:hypothetical protein